MFNVQFPLGHSDIQRTNGLLFLRHSDIRTPDSRAILNVPVTFVDASSATYSALAATSEYTPALGNPFVGIRRHPADLDSVSYGEKIIPLMEEWYPACHPEPADQPVSSHSWPFVSNRHAKMILCNFATCMALQSLFEWIASWDKA